MKRLFTVKTRNTLLILIAGLLLIAVALVVVFQELAERNQIEPVEWDITLTGSDGQQVILSYDELLSLPRVKTSGGFFSSVGAVYGPYTVKGIRLETLLDLVGGITSSDVLLVAARDGYSSVFDYRQLNGEVDTFEPNTLRLVPQGEVEFLLIYELQGQPLADNEGRPLRLAITSPDGLLTEGHWWVKWVNRLEIRALPTVTGNGE